MREASLHINHNHVLHTEKYTHLQETNGIFSGGSELDLKYEQEAAERGAMISRCEEIE